MRWEQSQSSPAKQPVLESLAAVSERNGLDPLAERLIELRGWLGDDLVALEEAISALAAGFVSEGERGQEGRKAAVHLLGRHGKRLRPICVMLAARVGGVGLTDEVRDLAVACEIVHAATLLHDDVIDEGTDRRGASASRMVFGNSASVLGGDHLLLEALQRVERVGLPGQLASLLQVISRMVGGEAMQLERRGRFAPDRDAYLDIIESKTASLFEWGLVAGATAGGVDPAMAAALGRSGRELGMAFQLVDDVLDLVGDPTVTGKNALADLREGKLTWPFILAAERDATAAGILESIVCGEGDPTDEALETLVSRLRAVGAVDDTRKFAAARGEAALEALAELPKGPSRRMLELVVDAAIRRVR